jgi:hypothetical protein
MNDLSSEARSLLREARGFDEPSTADADRVRASVLAKVGIAVGAGAGITAATTSIAAAPAATATLLGATAMKFGAAIVVAGSLATGGYVALRPAAMKRPAATEVAEARKAIAPQPPPAPEVPAPAIVPAPPPEDRREAAHPSHAKAPRRHVAPAPVERAPSAPRATSDLEGEARLLEQADADLRRGDANAALGRLAEHAAKYPAGALREEREGMRVVALCRAGRAAEGNAAAERFLARSPRSALATRIRAACGGD